MGEAFFYQKNYNAAANAFREALAAVPEPSEKWTEVWGHIYLGKIFDLLGQRARAVNEYSKAKQTNDNTSGAQQTAEALLKKPYSESSQTAANASGDAQAGADPKPKTQAPPADDGRPTLKKPQP
jgi:tetratricopeptide (TPR) repeat protein